MASVPMTENSRNSYLVLFLCSLGMASMGVTIQALTPVSHEVQGALGIDYGSLGFLMGAISIPGIFLSLPGGLLADRAGSRGLLLAGWAFMGGGALLFAIKPSYGILCAARILAGLGCSLVSVLLPGLIEGAFKGKSLGSAMGIFNAALPVGSILTLTTFAFLAAGMGPFRLFLFPAACAFLCFILFLFFLPGGREGSRSHALSLPGTGPLWLLALVVLFANMATMGYVTIAPSYFHERGTPPAWTGTMLSAVLWGSLLLSPVAGYLTTHRAMGKLLLAGGCFLQGLGLAAIPFDATPLTGDLFLLAMGSGLVMTPVYVLVPRVVKAGQVNTGFGIIFSSMMCGCLAGPYCAGKILDGPGGFAAGFMLLGALSAGAALSALLLGKSHFPSGNALHPGMHESAAEIRGDDEVEEGEGNAEAEKN
ncbi:MAG: MFS transporter [Candidatus Eremiobacteraeota bacterium]|nr:MFS transporter [Candidatus Eremiobacteraeota bacterium]